MATKECTGARGDGSSPTVTTKTPREQSAPGANNLFDGVKADRARLRTSDWSFDGVVRRVLGFSRAAELAQDTRTKSGIASPAFDALKLFVRSLDEETQMKLRTVMRAGRDAQAVQLAVAAVADDGPGELDLFARGTDELQDLQRGHAVAHATLFDLELAFTRWNGVSERESLDDRVWLRFGRELARSRIEEWSCLAVLDSRDRIQRLYLRRAKERWWSFDTLIDRPSEHDLGLLRSTRSARSRGRSRVVTLSVQAVLGRGCGNGRTAVRRASMALSARVGMCRVTKRARRTVARGAM